MKLKEFKNSAVRCVQNALRVCAVAVVYGYEQRKTHKELRYRERLQAKIVDEAFSQECPMPDYFLHLGDLCHHNANYKEIITQIDCLNQDFLALNDRPSIGQKKWRERFCNDLYTIWNSWLTIKKQYAWNSIHCCEWKRKLKKIERKGFNIDVDECYGSLSSSSSVSDSSIWSGPSIS